MKFPINISFRITNQEEYDQFTGGIDGWMATLADHGKDATVFAAVAYTARHHGDDNIVVDVPEAYVTVSGRRVSEGTFQEMYNVFGQEVAGHKASVILYKRDGMTYRAVQLRPKAK